MKKKKKKKGFTIIEILVVIAIVSIIVVTGGISASKLSEKSKLKKQLAFEEQIKNAASTYANIKELRSGCSDMENCTRLIETYDLIKEGLIKKDLINPSTQKNISTNLLIEISWTSNMKSVRLLEETFIFKDKILANNGGVNTIEAKPMPKFDENPTSGEMFSANDDYGKSYYFRGAVNNNWVKFGKENGEDIWWRIVRIVGNGSIKLIYTGTEAPTYEERVVMTGIKAIIHKERVSPRPLVTQRAYMYHEEEDYINELSHPTKVYLDEWYENNMISYDQYIEDTIFCSNRTMYSDYDGININTSLEKPSASYGVTAYYYSNFFVNNVINKFPPNFVCEKKVDSFTVHDNIKGNADLTYKVGMLTQDEALAGGMLTRNLRTTWDWDPLPSPTESNTYLKIGEGFWLMGFSTVSSSGSASGNANASGILAGGGFLTYPCPPGSTSCGYGSGNLAVSGFRPVINLKGNLQTIGTGMYNDPYVPIFD